MRSHRALSTVVGTVFAIIALTSTVTYISYSMGILNNYNQSVLTKNQQLIDTDKEKFQISSVTVPNNKLNITISNTGNLPINFTKLWIQNTTTVDWMNNYIPKNNFVAPGGVLTNIGQDIPAYINPSNSYNVKLVTSRGNTQQLNVNSANTAPLNIQFFAIPASVVSGFKTELIMVVVNNGSATLVNLSPTSLPTPTGSASCVASSVSPTSYSTLSPGSTAIFKWDVTGTISSGYISQSCTYTITQPLQNGYRQNLQTTITVSPVSLSSTNYAQNAGLLTITYTSFQWLQDSHWNSGWSIPGGTSTAFSIQIQNNNVTSNNVNLYISQQSQIVVYNPKSSSASQFYIAQAIVPNQSGFSITSYNCNGPPSNDYCINIPPGQVATLYFAQKNPGNSNLQVNMINSGNDGMAFIVMYGKFSSSQNGPGNQYGQNLPFLGILAS